jgi:hypothetical protein
VYVPSFVVSFVNVQVGIAVGTTTTPDLATVPNGHSLSDVGTKDNVSPPDDATGPGESFNQGVKVMVRPSRADAVSILALGSGGAKMVGFKVAVTVCPAISLA